MQSYKLVGMTCGACVAKVKSALESLEQVSEAQIQLEFPQVKLRLNTAITTESLQQAIGKYKIFDIDTPPRSPLSSNASFPEKTLVTYRPLILIVFFITGVTALSQFPFAEFSGMLWMRHFMAGFFLVFSFFKLLNIEGFANSYMMYDIIAARWKGWGYLYPFVELSLGVLYLTNVAPTFTNWATLSILGLSSIGVIQSVLDKRKIRCACLGDVFNLPMSTVTIIEDLLMVAMAAIMLWIR